MISKFKTLLLTALLLPSLCFAVPEFEAKARGGTPGGNQLRLEPPSTVNQSFAWVSGVQTPFTLSYIALTQQLTFTFGVGASQQVLTQTRTDSLFGTLTVAASIANHPQVNINNTISVSNLFLQSGMNSETGSNLFVGKGQQDSFTFSIPVSGDFILTGQTAFTWTGMLPRQDRMLVMISSAPLPVPIPEPSTYMMLGSMLFIAAFLKRKKPTYCDCQCSGQSC